MNKIRIHMIGAPHQNVIINDPHITTDPYVTKMYLLCKKFTEEGHEVIYYGVEGNEMICTKNIEYISKEMWKTHCENRDPNTSFEDHLYKPESKLYKHAEATLNEEVKENFKDILTDVILVGYGNWSPKLGELKAIGATIEYGIGYLSTFADYLCFESNAWMNTYYGVNGYIDTNKWFHSVIPGYTDPKNFEFKKKKEDYFLFLGRLGDAKGMNVAVQLAKHFKTTLYVAGNGDSSKLKDKEGLIKYVGVAAGDRKKELLANATLTFCLSKYVEPFGNVHIESLMSGTPVVTTDWGVYTETVPHGVVGFRGRTWEDFTYAIRNIKDIDPQDCRDWAIKHFSLESVYPKFIAYFEKCISHKYLQNGWYFDRFLESGHKDFYTYKPYITNYHNYFSDKALEKSPVELCKLKNIKKNQDVWVLGSGASVEYIDKEFFNNKTTICVNQSAYAIDNPEYIVIKDPNPEVIDYAEKTNATLLFSNFREGHSRHPLNQIDLENSIRYFHNENNIEIPEEFDFNLDKLIVSQSTITTAIHLAAYMGAKNIILVGHDCGTLDEVTEIKEYNTSKRGESVRTNEKYLNWLKTIEAHTLNLKEKLIKHYGVNITSLNPFINFNLEGHTFKTSEKY